MQDFLSGRISLVKSLDANEPAARYEDLVLILCAVLSACAAIHYPGRGIDRNRFIELLVMNSPINFRTSWISIPALINRGLINESQTLYGKPGNETRIFRDEEIDVSLDEAKNQYPEIDEKSLKKHCYASLIYEWLRCGYTHEYCARGDITRVPASRQQARVSYIGRSTKNGIKRMVSFHLNYLISIAEYHVSDLSREQLRKSSGWWIEI